MTVFKPSGEFQLGPPKLFLKNKKAFDSLSDPTHSQPSLPLLPLDHHLNHLYLS